MQKFNEASSCSEDLAVSLHMASLTCWSGDAGVATSQWSIQIPVIDAEQGFSNLIFKGPNLISIRFSTFLSGIQSRSGRRVWTTSSQIFGQFWSYGCKWGHRALHRRSTGAPRVLPPVFPHMCSDGVFGAAVPSATCLRPRLDKSSPTKSEKVFSLHL